MAQDLNNRDSISRRIAEMKSDRVPFTLRPDMPVNMMVELSNVCNHQCIFCASKHMQRSPGRISAGLLERVIQEGAEAGVREIGFYTTGDPLVHRGLEDFTRLAKRHNYAYTYISTNGGAGGPLRFKQIIDAGMDSVKFSINAGSRETYKLIHGCDQFEQVLANLRYVSEYRKTLSRKLNLFVTYVVTSQTRHECDAFLTMAQPLVDEVVFYPCDSQKGQMLGAGPLLGYETQPLMKRSDTAICPLPFNRLHVTYEGYLTLCCSDYENYLAVADLNKSSLVSAWNCDEFVKARERHLSRNLCGTLCGNCWNGKMDKIEPLNAEYANPIDFDRLYKGQAQDVEERLAEHRGPAGLDQHPRA
jgi:pyruvate-formate lyase-activating enzyme